PALVSGACGYAHYIEEAEAGRVIAEPFDQAEMNAAIAQMLGDDAARARWHSNALAYADSHDLYSLPERATDVILGSRGPDRRGRQPA
ncbi:glycosyltransferase family 1 protein, partial [Aromatoleum toluclasticum]|uniref:glycosyltransferase n=1 Tax=Aromatoleum toluclasticum TaxID=92003 RepID=UPI0034DB76B5|nr:glycosyltransferase family 1 protein [Aromatoleum toluclasticum]